jgi:branched-chain amino acid transport system permease protein
MAGLLAYSRSAAWLMIGALGLVAAGPLGLTDRYQTFVITTICVYAIITISVSTLAGLSGIWSVGHLAFVAIGAFATAYFSTRGANLFVIVVLSMVLSAAVGFLIGLTAGRFAVLYLAILTLALALVANEVIGRWTPVTGGDQGTPVAPFYLFGTILRPATVTLLAIAAATVVATTVDLLSRGRLGRRWLAIKNQRIAAIAIGLNPVRENATAFALSAAIASLAGVLLALQLGYISGDAFTLTIAINFIVAAVIGGVGSIAGAILGTAFIIAMPELARGVPAEFQVILFGAVMIAVLLFLPEGIVPGLYRRASLRIRQGNKLAPPLPPSVGANRFRASGRIVIGPDAGEGLIAEDITVRFGGLVALKAVNLRIGPAEVVALIGPNGAGKTTLLNVIGGFVRPVESPTLRFHSMNLLKMPPQARPRAGLARTFQHAELFSEVTVRETVTLAARLPRLGRAAMAPGRHAADILERLGLTAHVDRMPGELPFGIQKRVDIARALALNPSLMVMDEPFSGLDLKEQTELHDLIVELKQSGLAVLLVDHAVQQVLSLADRVYVLDYGRVIAAGLPDEIRADEAVRVAYFGTASVST